MTPETSSVLLHAFLDGELEPPRPSKWNLALRRPPHCARNWRAYPRFGIHPEPRYALHRSVRA